jgi:hypothetical protein
VKFILTLFLIAPLMIFNSCADSIVESVLSIDEDKEPVDISPTFSGIQEKIFNPSCALSGCHVNGSQTPNLSLNSYSNIVNKQSSTGMDYIEPGNPGNSYLLQKVLGSNVISGSRMPLNDSPVSQEKIDIITEWINNGAKDD